MSSRYRTKFLSTRLFNRWKSESKGLAELILEGAELDSRGERKNNEDLAVFL